MITRTTFLICVLCATDVVNCKASPESFYNENIPPGVTFGISPEELAQTRPQAQKNNLIQSKDEGTGESGSMVEITRQGRTGTAYWYHFRNGKLGAVSRSISTKNLSIELAQSNARPIYSELLKNFDLRGQQEILRLSGAGTSPLTAQLWEDKEKKKNVYFLASSQEISIIIFDPEKFGAADFFVSFDKRKELDAQAKKARQILGDASPSPSPVIDLMPEVIKHVSGSATSSHSTVTAQQPQSETQPVASAKPIPSKPSASGFSFVWAAIIAVAMIVLVVFLPRRKR